ncbi:hypothetical protein TNCV_2978261 [Trichonephila clavipes]|nr:hypothetical protein TNCV_2978261 [Trichonephila clavipes]
MSSSPVPLKTRRVGERCALNLSRAQMSFRWCGGAHVTMFELSVLPERCSEAYGEDDLLECFDNGSLGSSLSRQRDASIQRKILHSITEPPLIFTA